MSKTPKNFQNNPPPHKRNKMREWFKIPKMSKNAQNTQNAQKARNAQNPLNA